MSWNHIQLTYVCPFYIDKGNADELLRIVDEYNKYPADLLDQMLFVFVDDGSPQPYQFPPNQLNLILLRATQNIPWNNPGARNLGMIYAKSDKVLITDIDMRFSAESLQKIINMAPPGRKIYKLPRTDAEGKKVRAHPNTFVLSRRHFFGNFGYDEAFCGHYGNDDSFFSKYCKLHGFPVVVLRNGAQGQKRFPVKEEIKHSLNRDHTTNQHLLEAKIEDIKTSGPDQGHSREFLNFPYEIVKVQRRDVPAAKPNKTWWLMWYWRWICGHLLP